MSIVAIIPARSGSRRLPGKNIMKLGDKTLVGWANAVAIECGLDTILTTNSEEIMSIERCELCERQIDTDFEDDCYVEVPWLNLEDHIWCAQCQNKEFIRYEIEHSGDVS